MTGNSRRKNPSTDQPPVTGTPDRLLMLLGLSGVASAACIVTAIVGVTFGVAMVPFVQGAHAGLLERISVGILPQWYVVMGLLLMRVSRGAFPLRQSA